MLGILLIAFFSSVRARDFRVIDLQPGGTNAGWRIRWTAVPGAVYQLQRVEGDRLPVHGIPRWIPVVSVRATNGIASAEDPAGSALVQRFYRVVEVDPVFRIIDIVHVGTNRALRMSWESVPGFDYRVERSSASGLERDSLAPWNALTTLRATSKVSYAEDQILPELKEQFYRVALLTAGGEDSVPPSIAFREALLTTGANGSPALKLSFTATDDRGVAEVAVREGELVLGLAQLEGDSNWVYSVPVDSKAFDIRRFSATARDLSGKQGNADPVDLLPVNPDFFVPVSTDGHILEQHALIVTGATRISEFVYRPGGRPRPGFAPDLWIRFPDGAALSRTTNGELVLEFVRAVADFDSASPLRLAAPLQRNSGEPARLLVGPLSYSQIVSIFNADPTNGIPLKVFGRFDLRWRGGQLDDRGLVGAQFQPAMRDLPLPAWSAALPDYLVEFSKDRTLRIPFVGNFVLPDRSPVPARLGISPGRPMWLGLKSDGAMSLEGPVELIVSSNLNLRAQFRFEDPKYHFTLAAPSLQYRGLTNLAPLLAGNPEQCLGGTTPDQRERAQLCLETLARSYAHFSGAISEAATSAPPAELPMPGSLDPGADPLEAWSLTALAQPNRSQNFDPVLSLAVQKGLQAAASPELLETLGARLVLLRCRWALQQNSAAAGALEVLDNTLAQADAAALDRADAAIAGLPLSTMVKLGRWLTESEALRLSNNLPRSTLLNSGLPPLFIELANQLAYAWGVTSGVFSPEANPYIRELGRHEAMETLRGVVEFRGDAQSLAYPLNTTPIDEFSGQLARRALETVQEAMLGSFLARELPAFVLAARDYVDLAQWAQADLLPELPELAELKIGPGLTLLQNQLAILLQADLERPPQELSLGRYAAELRVLLAVIRKLPDASSLPRAGLSQIYNQVEAQLASRAPASVSNRIHLLEWLEAGTLHRELAERFALVPVVSWETVRLPQVVSQLNALAKPARAWRELDQGAAILLEASRRLDLSSSLSVALRTQVAPLLTAARETAQALATDAQTQLRRVDFALPGDAQLDEPAGYVFYNRLSGQLHGAMRGRLRLPTFGLELTVPNASLDSGGALDLSAFGELDFDGGLLVVPERMPLHLRHAPDHGLTFEGGTGLVLDNGLKFDASVALTDPIYRFALSARGIEFNLGRELMLQRPALTEFIVQAFQDDTRDALAEYLRRLNGSVENLLVSLGNFQPVDPNGPGRPPEFVAPEATLDFGTINAWSADVITRAKARLSQAQDSMIVPLLDAVRRLNREAEVARDAIVDERARMASLAARISMRREIKTALNAMADPGADFDSLLQEVERGLRQEASNVVAMATADVAQRLPDALDVVRLLTEAEAAFQAFNLPEAQPTLPSDPCAAFTQANASLGQRAEALTACAATTYALSVGINPATGAITDSNKFLSLSTDQLEQSLTVLLETEALMQARGHEGATVMPVAEPLVRRHRELLQAELAQSTDLARQLELASQLLDNLSWSQGLGVLTSLTDLQPVAASITNTLAVFKNTAASPEKFSRLARARQDAQKARENRSRQNASAVRRALGRDRVVQLVGPDSEYVPDFFTQLANFLRLLHARGGALTPGSLSDVDGFVRGVAAELRARPFTPGFLTNRMSEAVTLLNGVIGLTDWAGARLTNDLTVITNLAFAITNLSSTFNGIAQAQKAWWLLDRYQDTLRRHTAAYGTNAAAALNTHMRQARAATLNAARQVNDSLNTLLGQVRFQDVLVTLPGEVEIRNVHGRLHYDRSSGYLEGCFGGRLEFPGVSTNLFFDITQACLASDGSFSLITTNSTPLPFEGVRLAVGVNVSGSPAGIATFQGAGTLWVPDQAVGDRVFNVAVSYDQAAKRMAFDARGDNLDLVLCRDFVLFNAAIGFELAFTEPNGKLRVSGSAGLVARHPTQPLPEHPSAADFQLVVTNLTTVLAYTNETIFIQLNNGALLLPELFRISTSGVCAANSTPPAGPMVEIKSANPITVRIVTGDTPQAFFSGGLDFRNIGFEVPGLPGLEVDFCSARLAFSSESLPRFTNLTASIQIPLPNATSRVDILDAAWSMDGFPSGTVRLGNNITFLEAGGFSFVLLGTNNTVCTNGSGFSIQPQPGGDTAMTLFGGIGVTLDEFSLAWADGTRISAQACGGVTLRTQGDPEFFMDGLGVAGDFRLGGSGGIKLQQASLEMVNVDQLFRPRADAPFQLKVNGTIVIPFGPGLILSNACFTFANGAPDFSIKGLSLTDPPDWLPSPLDPASMLFASAPLKTHKFEPVEGLALDVSAVGIVFLDPHLRLPQLLNPTNISLTVSAMLNLPPENPLFIARVDGLTLRWINDALQAGLNGMGLGFDNLQFPPLTLKGIIYVGGINSADVFHSTNLFFAGQVGAKIEDVGAIATLAITPKGILGVCLDVNAGPAGIPIDGGALGGVLLTGAAGGVTFTNASDPCDFMSLISIPSGNSSAPYLPSPLLLGQSRLVTTQISTPTRLPSELISWSELAAIQRRDALGAQLPLVNAPQVGMLSLAPLTAPATALRAEDPAAPCTLEPCPPPTISLLCQPHPDQAQYSNRVIIKFTSLDEAQLNALGITRDTVSTLGGTPEELGQHIAVIIRQFIDALLPRAELGGLLDAQQILAINTGITNVLNDVENAFAGLMRDAVQGVLGNPGAIYDSVKYAAYAGVPCPSVSVKLTGTLSHAVVSTFLSGTVGALLSSDGSAGVVGSINLVGIPVGTVRGFVAASDARGNPNPSFCGQMQAALGPLELGMLQALYSCDGCSDGLGAAFLGLAGCLGGQADVIIHEIAGKIAPDLLPAQLATEQVLSALSTNTTLMAAFMGELFRYPSLPPGLPECFLQAMGSAWNSFQPRILVCGEAKPKLFGIPLMGEVGSVYLDVSKGNMTARVGMSPSYVLNNTLLCLSTSGALCQGVFPALDEGSVGFGLSLPDPAQLLMAGLSGQLNSPEAVAAYLEDGFAYMLRESTFTLTYKLNPFGFEIADAQGRVILPNLTEHPSCSGGFIRPENRGLPSRLELLLAASATNLLGNPAWKGDSNTLAWAFPVGDPRRDQIRGLTLNQDYFPYGGVAGAMRLQMPRALVDSPPPVLGQIFEDRPLLERLSAAAEYVSGYVLAGSEIGTLAFYVPAPNPPCLPTMPTPRQLLEQISKFDPLALAPPDIYPEGPYPLAEAFMQGYLDGRLLGVPIAQATVELEPPQGTQPGYFRGQAQIPAGSWLSNFLDSATATFEIRQSPPLPINVAFSNLLAQVTQATNSGNQEVMNELAAGLGGFLATNLPKAALTVSVSNLHVPPELADLVTASGTANFLAFSPWYDPLFPGAGPVANARRNGGIALQGQLRFADFVTVENAELAVSLSDQLPLPALSGLFDVPVLNVPGLPLRNAHFAFDSGADIGDAVLAAAGELDPISFINPLTGLPLLTIQNLTNPAARIAADFSLRRASEGPPLPEFAISPSQVQMPMLGPGLVVRIHGATNTAAFTFSSTGSWTSQVSIAGQLRVQDLFGNEVARIGSAGEQFSAVLEGQGMGIERLAINVPAGMLLTIFPNDPAVRQTFTFGNPGGSNRLEIASNGSFLLHGELGGALPLSGLGFSSISGGASFTLTENSLTISGQVNGGALEHVDNLPSAQGAFTVSRSGVTLSGSVSVPPFTLGVFMVSGGNGANITATLDNTGLVLANGAALRLLATGYPTNQDLFILNEFTIAANGDFNVSAQSGELSIPGYLNLTSGTFTLKRIAGVATLQVHAPTLTVLPNASFPSTSIAAPFTDLIVSSTGQFYANTGLKGIALPAGFGAQGQLEIGYEPDPRQPALTMSTNPINFGTVNYGSSSNQTFTLQNTNLGLLRATLVSSAPGVFRVSPSDLALEPGQLASVSVRFTPAGAGTTNATLSVLHNAPGGPRLVPLSGNGRAVPLLRLSASALAFSEVKLNQSARLYLRLDNLGLQNLAVTSSGATMPFTATPSTLNLAPGAHAEVTVVFSPTTAGAYTRTLQFSSNDPNGIQNVPLTGTGYQSQWYLQREGGSALNAIAMNSSGRGFAVGDGGLIMHTINAGHSWSLASVLKPISVKPSRDLSTLKAGALAEDGATGVVGGSGGKVFVTADSGATWLRHTSGIAGDPSAVWNAVGFVPGTRRHILAGSYVSAGFPRHVVAVAQNDSGTAYTTNAGLQARVYQSVASAAVGGQPVMLVGGATLTLPVNGVLLRSTNAGLSWASVTLPSGATGVRGVALLPSGTALLVTDSGQVYQSANGGISWILRSTGRGTLQAVAFCGSTVAYAANREGEIWRCVASGGLFSSWTKEEAMLGDLRSLAADSVRAWCVGAGARIYHRPSYTLDSGILTFEPGSLNFGFVPVADSTPRVLTLYNRGRAGLVVSGFSPTVPGISSEFVYSPALPVTILAGQKVEMNVSYRPTTTHNFSGELVISSSDPDAKQALGISGRSATHGWVLNGFLPDSAGSTAVDLQMTSDTVGYALTPARLYRTMDAGVTWTALTLPLSDTLRAFHFVSDTTGWLAGGSFGKITTPDTAFILKTTTGGANWTTVFNDGSKHPVANIHFADANNGYAVTLSKSAIPVPIAGAVLQTTNGGASWSTRTIPASRFDGAALHAVSASEVFASRAGVLYRSADSAGSWAPVVTNASGNLLHVFFPGTVRGYTVGNGGALWSTAMGGDTPAEWSSITPFTSAPLNSVHFVDYYLGWTTPSSAATGAAIYRSDDGGSSWREELAESPLAGPGNLKSTVVWGRNSNLAIAMGTDGCVRRYQPYIPEPTGIALAPPVHDFGSALLGAQVSSSFVLRNVGTKVLVVSGVSVDGSDPGNYDFKVPMSLPFTIRPGNSQNFTVVAYNRTAGTRTANLEIVTDGVDPVLSVELRSTTVAPPNVVVLKTDPPGLHVTVDGVSLPAPIAFTVRKGATGPWEWEEGSEYEITVEAVETVAGQDFTFVEWQPAEDPGFLYTALPESRTWVARFVASGSSGVAGLQPMGALELQAASSSAGVPTGPYVRLSNGSITNRLLADFRLSGAALLSANLIDASLDTTPVVLRGLPGAAPVAEITGSTWRFLYSNSTARLRAQSPALELVGTPVTRPANLEFTFNSSGHFWGSFSLPQGWPVAPGLLEFGPSSLTLAHTNFYQLSCNGQLGLLRKPDGNWAYQPALTLNFRDGPFTNSILLPSTVMQLFVPASTTEFLAVRGGGGARFDLRRDGAGNFSAALTGVGLDVLGRALGTFSGAAYSSGLLRLNLNPPSSPFVVGPLGWIPAGPSQLDWNIRNGALSFTLAGGTLSNSFGSVPGWPAGGLAFPGVVFNSAGDFDVTITLPSFSFDGIGLGNAADAGDRYAAFRRVNGVLSLLLRDQRDFFGSTMSLGFDINSSGGVSGFFKGSFGVDFDPPIGYVDFGSVSLDYASGASPYQFTAQFPVAGNDFRIQFGADGGQVCHLWCNGSNCSPTVCLQY